MDNKLGVRDDYVRAENAEIKLVLHDRPVIRPVFQTCIKQDSFVPNLP